MDGVRARGATWVKFGAASSPSLGSPTGTGTSIDSGGAEEQEAGGEDRDMGAKYIGAVVQAWFEMVDELKKSQPKKKSSMCVVQ